MGTVLIYGENFLEQNRHYGTKQIYINLTLDMLGAV